MGKVATTLQNDHMQGGGHERKHIDVDDIAGLAEIADELGVTRQSVSNWASGRARIDFPKPFKRLRATPLWSLTGVLTWHQTTQ